MNTGDSNFVHIKKKTNESPGKSRNTVRIADIYFRHKIVLSINDTLGHLYLLGSNWFIECIFQEAGLSTIKPNTDEVYVQIPQSQHQG
jgi:hypothetical protein